ncbi:hypothetical protein NQ318_002428 [Aromia moschata]|uniref:Uncharacterized protein n=1 Tax=Aromia moschata TaxID=1265417 RepID=A0AAV8YHP8_9CUCU|nr:hypothetical protein NQ318_002428 [Aromia moschata]
MRPVLPTRAKELSRATVVNSVHFAQIRISSCPGIPVRTENEVIWQKEELTLSNLPTSKEAEHL